MAYGPPVYIDPVTLGDVQGQNSPNTAMQWGPFKFGGSLFQPLKPYDAFADRQVVMWKSTDNGATWAAVDAANGPTCYGLQVTFDGAQTATVCFQHNTLGNIPQPIQLVNFDLATEAWQAPSAASPFSNIGGPQALFKRPGDFLVLVSTDVVFPIASLSAVAVTGGVWGVPFAVDTAAQAAMVGFNGWGEALAAIDAAGTMHVSFGELDGAFLPHHFYVAVTVANAVVNPHEFLPTADGSIGIPFATGTDIVLPVLDSVNNLIVFQGTPTNAPVWTRHDDVDPTFTPSGISVPQATLLAGAVVISYAGPSAPSIAGLLRLVSTLDFVTWTGTTVFDINVPPFGPAGDLLQALFLTADGLGVSGLDPTATQFQRIWLPSGAAPPPVIVVSGSPPNGVTLSSYPTFCFAAAGGTPPYAFTIFAGFLPPGLVMGLPGCITGTPTAAGTFCFTVLVTDSTLATGALGVCITILRDTIILLYGWKLYKLDPCDESFSPAIEVPPVKRAV